MSFKVIIPARYGSSRFPGKPLALIAGRPMIAHVLERAQRSEAEQVVVATDDERIEAVVRALGAPVVRTASHHPSGTDRLAEAVQRLGYASEDVIVNVQGDEPLVDPHNINQVARCLARHPQAAIATLATPLTAVHDWQDPNVVKVVTGLNEQALYFSRAPIPWPREAMRLHAELPAVAPGVQRHIGLYAYRVQSVQAIARLSPTPLEQTEQLEQLRAMEHGLQIVVTTAQVPPGPGVDTPDDLVRVNELVAQLTGQRASAEQ